MADVPMWDRGDETPNYVLKECQGLSGIKEKHEVKEKEKIEELLLFCDLDKI